MATTLYSPQSSKNIIYGRTGDNASGSEGRILSEVTESEIQSTERDLLRMTGPSGTGSNGEWKTSERITIKSRQNSLRRTKNSTDLLRERSRNPQGAKNDVAQNGDPGSRERKARQFTVGNVGNNGMIYLRLVEPLPMSLKHNTISPDQNLPTSQFILTFMLFRPVKRLQQQQQQPPSPPPRNTSSTFPSKTIAADPTKLFRDEAIRPNARDSIWTFMSTTIQTPPPIPQSSGPSEVRARRQRSFSQSTVDAQSNKERLETGALRIVIDRPGTAPKPDEISKASFPTIEVPIPHYRLGSPRFSAKGTAFLHQSAYTRQSSTGESSVFSGVEYEHIFPKPPGIEAHAVISRRHSHASHQLRSLQASPIKHSFSTPVQTNSLYQSNEPITPQMYDHVATYPDDPAIVKYSLVNGDIVAATPARLIAQITSENFLDYELLSNFFLTVRSYLSTRDLLSYLLARFEWAINRFDDNGRIIRVRAFAALRHWILNYFSYDFVVDRELRVQFCERLNVLTGIVKARANYGASDMKLIADLKKCWNGRCMLYWDSPVATGEALQEVDIQPGGILGSRDSQLVHQSQLRAMPTGNISATLTVNPAQLTAGTPTISKWYSAVMDTGERQNQSRIRHTSTGTLRNVPISPMSEQSMPVLSCSIPAKGLKKAVPYANRALGIHPIPVDREGRRVCPAASSSLSNEPTRPVAAHRRSGSFSDAARDKRAPLSSEVPNSAEDIAQELSCDRSLLRGQLIPPGSPHVNIAPTTPAAEVPNLGLSPSQGTGNENQTSRKPTVQNNPAVKSLIGNIRRALSSKHSGSNTPSNGGPDASSLSIGKSATLPLNVVYQGSSAGHAEALRSQARLDLLAANIAEAYQRATSVPSAVHTSSIGIASGNEREQPSPSGEKTPTREHSNGYLQPPDLQRLASGVTSSSQSILIMDDTGLNLPDLPGLSFMPSTTGAHLSKDLEVSAQNVSVNSGSDPSDVNIGEQPDSSGTQSRSSFPFLISEEDQRKAKVTEDNFPDQTRHPLTRNQSFGTSKSTSFSLRRYASFQSTFTKHAAGKSIDATATGTSATGSAGSGPKETPARMLRRRPGGDLRANQNVHDLKNLTRPKSVGSITTHSDSVRGSQLLGFGEKITRTFTVRKSPRDLVSATPMLQREHQTESGKATSFVRTHSSQPEQRRPSFEAAVAHFANIPDDEEGGPEATLLKLEGRYRSPIQSPIPQSLPDTRSEEGSNSSSRNRMGGSKDKVENQHGQEQDSSSSLFPNHQDGDDADYRNTSTPPTQNLSDATNIPRETIVSTLYADSEDSYNSIPLLERSVDQSSRKEEKRRVIPSRSLNRGRIFSGEGAHDTNSMRVLKRGSLAPTVTTDSFLLDENDEFLSDVSSEISLDTIDGEEIEEQWKNAAAQDQGENMVLVGQQHPPSPPMTMENALSITSQAHQAHEQRKPPTPDPSPVSQHVEPDIPRAKSPGNILHQPRHIPFILGFDSEVLAQQFTIIEQDALREIDWRDLVDMRWQTSATSTTNWVEYLLTQDPLGIDLVTARFNIVVKWALSEIVLTENLQERALTVIKYIHVAQQARRIHNYATVLQLTIALTSTDCTRLNKTWSLVPSAEKDTLEDLEMLVSPRRNFHNLRTEMEKVGADQGCIPVLGTYHSRSPKSFRLETNFVVLAALYIHDLTYNSQKPLQVPASRDGELLINFERHRSAASIVKNLLLLIEASSKYPYQPVEGAIDRCLWMACLPDEIITHKSKQLVEFASV